MSIIVICTLILFNLICLLRIVNENLNKDSLTFKNKVLTKENKRLREELRISLIEMENLKRN